MTITMSNPISAVILENLYLGISCILVTCLLNDVILGVKITEDLLK